ncbi:PREDICTED: MATH domain and coiled-coil domain-containing protein At3g58240-like [Camelina sativa]|uniref:MATH domain and coiled-coil domain-containing protein At3g58240-like n=1 Tax=Camelina sativa TaxID=90675 RepID=A0ABM0YRD5_CAMSA|nr:PREDICTED: MATH domain and coiled-coil domain-containing protein At3g58240-like [Camelina sativa]
MGNQVDNKFTWLIKDYCTWLPNSYRSDQFVIGGCTWYLHACFRRHRDKDFNCLYVYLVDADFESAWRRDERWIKSVQVTFTVVNQLSQEHSKVKAAGFFFDHNKPKCSISMIRLSKLHAKDAGFLVNDELEIVVVIDVLSVSDGSLKAKKPLNRPEEPIDLVDVNGLQVIPSEVDLARRIFELHPKTAKKYRTKNEYMRRFHTKVLLDLTKRFFKVPYEDSSYDVSDFEGALTYLKSVGFKLDWLEKKLDEVKENKKKCARLTKLEQQRQDMMDKYTDVRNQLEKERAEIKKTAHDLSFIDIV